MIEIHMEIEEHLPKTERRFMAKYDRYEPKIRDSTAIRSLKTCAKRYFFEIVLGRTPKETAIYFAWGSAYHLFREVLEKEYGYGHDRPAVFDEEKAKQAYATAALAGTDYWRKHGQDQDAGSKYAFATMGRLLKSFLVAFDFWKKEKLQGRIEVIAVEQAFNVQLADGSYTSGKADQIIRWSRGLWGRDFKTSSKPVEFYSRTLEPNDQFTRYTLSEGKMSGEVVRGQFVEVLWNAKPTKNKDNGPEIHEFTTSRTAYQLEQFEHEQSIINKQLELYRQTDTYPMQEISCSFCPFHSVCTKPTEGAMMAQLEAHFKVRPWDNTRIGLDD